MNKEVWTKGKKYFLIPMLALSLGLVGCADDGDDGAQGPAGPPGSAVIDINTQTPETLTADITSVTIASSPIVNFKVADGNDTPVIGLTTSNVRFIIAKLVPGTNADPNVWQSYVNRTETPTPGVGSETDPTTQATTESDGTLVDHEDGTYTYTFTTDVAAATDPTTGAAIPYDPTLTHRVAIQLSGGGLPVVNPVFDFVPSGGALTTARKIAMTASCNECHDPLAIHGGGRIEVDYCVTCHNPGTVDANSGNNLDLAEMVHKIHMGLSLPSVQTGGEYAIWGYRDSKHDYSHVGYPQEITNCRKCHTVADAATPQGDNWKMVPSIQACGSCHDDVDFATGAGHVAGMQSDNSGCVGCHSAAKIEEYHTTPNATENNPALLAGQSEITYDLIGVTVDDLTGNATIIFTINSNGTPLDLTALPADLAGPGRYPGFLLAWAEPQSGMTVAPADFNNLGQSAAQPIGVGIDDLSPINDGVTDPILGTLVCNGGVCTAVINAAGSTFPVGATMRTVGLQGYFQQDLTGNGASDVSLHTQSVVMTATGDTLRRSIADSAKCAACHEIFEGHGGNRNFTVNGGVEICTLCHVPNLSSSGRTLDVGLPEDTNNFKDLIHGIHGAANRVAPMEFVRNFRNNGNLYAFLNSDNIVNYIAPTVTGSVNDHLVTYPASSGNCTNCHLDGTFAVPTESNLLPTTVRTMGAVDAVTADVVAARDNVPNATDWVNSPIASACVYCHDSELAAIHMMQNGGVLSSPVPGVGSTARQNYEPMESCAVCHGPGKQADVSVVHGL